MTVQRGQIVFWSSPRSYRTLKMVGVTILCVALAFFPTWRLLYDVTHGTFDNESSTVAMIFSPLFVYLLVVSASKLIRNPIEPVEITSDGVRIHREFWPWSRIASIRPARQSFSRCVFPAISLVPPPPPSSAATPTATVIMPRTVVVSRIVAGQNPLRPEEYAALVAQLGPWLAANHPHVQLG